MRSPETIRGYAAIRSAEYRSVARAETYVEWAQDMLEEGFESPALLSLAIADPPYFTPDLKRLFDTAAEHLAIEPLSGPQALVLHAMQVAAELTARSVSPTQAGALIASIFTADIAPPGFGQWQLIDEASWCDYCRQSFVGDGRTLEEAIIAEATKLLTVSWRAA